MEKIRNQENRKGKLWVDRAERLLRYRISAVTITNSNQVGSTGVLTCAAAAASSPEQK